MNIHPTNNRYIKEVIEDEGYKFLHHYPLVVDVGANIGTFSMWIYDMADKIYALEPVLENVEHLRGNVERNALNKIIVKQMALSNKSTVKQMVKRGEAENGGWTISEAGDYEVDCRTLNDFIESEKIDYIDLLKLDTEGHEFNILNAPYFPYKKLGTIIGELHSDYGRDEVKNLLEWYGYKYREYPNGYFLAKR